MIDITLLCAVENESSGENDNDVRVDSPEVVAVGNTFVLVRMECQQNDEKYLFAQGDGDGHVKLSSGILDALTISDHVIELSHMSQYDPYIVLLREFLKKKVSYGVLKKIVALADTAD